MVFLPSARAGQWWWEGWSSSLWRAHFWLPAGITWDDLRNTEHFTFPNFYHVWLYPWLFSIVLIIVRCFFLEPYVFSLFAQAAAITNWRPAPPVANSVLEAVYRQYKVTVPRAVVKQACEDSRMSERQVERWLRRRHAHTRSTKYDKFVDCSYDFLCHVAFTALGLPIMYSKPWLWNITLCWEGYPHHSLDDDLWWYYMLYLAYYWSTTFIIL
ncbi:Ceramide synthase 3-like [Homarus americanus]|uniref:Ceramide synthase 3-like n=1 Tax=Homarus americanus TaxID=6706 RepID=A0A8J5JFS0_HOMAM|nr:Ceramide synthase 3-like [Homarus americanus]